MTLRKLEDITATALRDHGSRDRIDRVWRRLASDMESAAPRRRNTLWWAPAAAVIIFGSGVMVGAKWARPEPSPLVTAEVTPASEPATPGQAPATAAEERRPERTPSEPRRVSPRAVSAPEQVPAFAFDEEPVQPLIEMPTAPAGPPEWKQLADSGDFEAAGRALDRAGGFDAVLGGANSAQLMSLVDIARATGGRDRAVLALRRVLDGYPDTPEAPLAAWTLGNVLEQAGDEAGAAEAFALYRRLSPSGDFAEDAVVREVEAALEKGNLELAAQLVDQYAKDYPHGRRLDEFRRELEELRAANAGVVVEQPAAPAPAAPPSQVKGVPAAP
ncbi:MAG TPA: tetratricopeptide repeat protein [Polyangiaceae bacterium]|nr:tetratricopeptide repeat protein [Polyangiaceae bacterium]